MPAHLIPREDPELQAAKARTRLYYVVKPLLPRRTQLGLRRGVVRRRRILSTDIWPIDEQAGVRPSQWQGWPDGKQFAIVFTHDIEHFGGQLKCDQVMRMERAYGFRSSFYFVPERYRVLRETRRNIVENGCEIGVHDYNHDGKLFSAEHVFNKRAPVINQYIAEWRASGFRSGAMHHNLEWIGRLNVEYDCSTFDTDPFEPQPDGVRTVFPFRVEVASRRKEYIEMPYTLPQDFTLFVLMRERGPDIWKHKLKWIAETGGLALVNVHPDYMSFEGEDIGLERYPADYYEEFLRHVASTYEGKYWHALPRDVARYWRATPDDGNVVRVGDGGTR